MMALSASTGTRGTACAQRGFGSLPLGVFVPDRCRPPKLRVTRVDLAACGQAFRANEAANEAEFSLVPWHRS